MIEQKKDTEVKDNIYFLFHINVEIKRVQIQIL